MGLEAASLFLVGFPGLAPDAEVERLVDAGVGGVILFARNVASAGQCAGLVRALKARAGRPLLAAVDQEGGRVARLKGAPFTRVPPLSVVGARGDEALARAVGRLLAYEVRSVGFDWDFAPVLDVDTNPANPVIGDRAFHRDAAQVARLGVALAGGLEDEGVASCGKHFPGHGDTAQDSHRELPVLGHPLSRLEAVELPPFAAYARAGLASVMTAHVVFEALAPGVPATLSPRVLTGLLRERLGFSGVIVSDDLEMQAIADRMPVEEAAVQALAAGADALLVCHRAERQWRAIEAVQRAVESGRLSRARFDEARGRMEALARRFCRPAESLEGRLGSAAHRALAAPVEALSGEVAVGVDPTESGQA